MTLKEYIENNQLSIETDDGYKWENTCDPTSELIAERGDFAWFESPDDGVKVCLEDTSTCTFLHGEDWVNEHLDEMWDAVQLTKNN